MIIFNSTIFSTNFQKKQLVNSLRQGYSVDLNLNHNTKTTKWKIAGRIASDPLKASLYQFKQVNNNYLLKISFNSESSNLIYVVVYVRLYRRNKKSSEQKNKNLLATYEAAAISTISSWRTTPYLYRQKVSYVSLSLILQSWKECALPVITTMDSCTWAHDVCRGSLMITYDQDVK